MWPNGVRFIGEYKNNEKIGKGKYFFGGDDYIEGNFVCGRLVGFNVDFEGWKLYLLYR